MIGAEAAEMLAWVVVGGCLGFIGMDVGVMIYLWWSSR